MAFLGRRFRLFPLIGLSGGVGDDKHPDGSKQELVEVSGILNSQVSPKKSGPKQSVVFLGDLGEGFSLVSAAQFPVTQFDAFVKGLFGLSRRLVFSTM
jgi:hypothetical protein